MEDRVGSSPLARGLPLLDELGLREVGIIPARAGFTPAPQSRPSEAWDHPRSRGVYNNLTSYNVEMTGSSPLARGLRIALKRSLGPLRIIPARAGFTYDDYVTGIGLRDHPRSRGVYAATTSTSESSGGSSPLARGLLNSPGPGSFATQDHPRSRGVYALESGMMAFSVGSSPLARGLLVSKRPHAGHRRIIPARAGFTECRS